MTATFRVLLLPEDAKGNALRELVRRLFREWEDDGHTRRVEFEFLPHGRPLEALRTKAYAAHDSAKPRRGQPDRQVVIDFYRYLARQLAESRFVIHHTDGDTAWKDRPNPASEATRARVRARLAEAIRNPRPMQRPPARGAPTQPTDAPIPEEAEVERLLRYFIDCVPYYSLEAWCYQATRRAVELCIEHHGGKHVDLFTAWSADPWSLDDEEKPKDGTCLKGNHNDDLAKSLRPSHLLPIGKSFHAFAESLRAIPELGDALAPWW